MRQNNERQYTIVASLFPINNKNMPLYFQLCPLENQNVESNTETLAKKKTQKVLWSLVDSMIQITC